MVASALFEFLTSELADEFERRAFDGVTVSRVSEVHIEVRCASWVKLCCAIDVANQIDPEEP